MFNSFDNFQSFEIEGKWQRYIDSTDRGLIRPTVSPWLYQSRAVEKRRPETDTSQGDTVGRINQRSVLDLFQPNFINFFDDTIGKGIF